MIILKAPANIGGEIKQIGAVVNLSPLAENRMIENGYATRFNAEKVVEVEEKQAEKPVISDKKAEQKQVGGKNEPKRPNKK